MNESGCRGFALDRSSMQGILLKVFSIHSFRIEFNLLEPTGHYMYHQFNIQQFCILPTLYLCVLCGSQNKQRLFPYTALTDWFL